MSERKMMNPAKKSSRNGGRRFLNALVYSLVLLAVLLGLLAAWSRHVRGEQLKKAVSQPSYVVEQGIEAVEPKVGFAGEWVQAAAPLQNSPSGPTRSFVCSQCQTRCWTGQGRGCPACPFCGQPMARQGAGPGPGIGSGWGGAVGQPRAVLAASTCRFFCARCQWSCWVRQGDGPPVCPFCGLLMTRRGPGLSPAGGAVAGGAGQIQQKAIWCNVAAPPITADALRPVLIKEFGIEVCAAPGTGAKVTGVMGNSFAASAGLRAGDIIIECNGAEVRGVKQLQQLVAQAAPETDAQIVVLRNGRTRDLLIMVGEGEMEGFTPIQRP